jgi:two-component system, chemotaxis family, protein-glutamate methylesterase/glutaminase
MATRDIIVVGASAGGVEALSQLARGLPPDLAASIFVVLHLPAGGASALAHILDRAGPLSSSQARDGEPINHAHIYVAPPDHHLLVRRGHVTLVRGPRENNHRPAVDPLFRSAARAYGSRVVGVILSGALDDGTAGLLAVKTRGGVAVVQSPDEALFSGMPTSALHHVNVDHCVPLAEIPRLLNKLSREEVDETRRDPMSGDENGTESLLASRSDALEAALWVALRALEETQSMTDQMAERAERRGHHHAAERFAERARDASARAAVVRRALQEYGRRDSDQANSPSAASHAVGEW